MPSTAISIAACLALIFFSLVIMFLIGSGQTEELRRVRTYNDIFWVEWL